MPIQRNAAGGSVKFISEPGEYIVEIANVQFGKSKKGDPMVTVVFQTEDDRSIKSFFVPKYPFMEESLNKLKIACSGTAETTTDKLIGKKCGILVDKGKINSEGKSFPQVVGFGSINEVDSSNTPHGYESPIDDATDTLPF